MNKKFCGRLCAASLLVTLLCTQSGCGFIVFNTDTSTPPDTSEPVHTDTAYQDTDLTETAGTSVPTTQTDWLTSIKERLSELPDRDLSATSVIIAVTDETVLPEQSDDPVTISRLEVKKAVEEKYNTSIVAIERTPDEMFEAVRNAYNSDMYYADIISIPQSMLGTYYTAGVLANLRSLPHTDFDAPCYNASVISAASAGSELYGVSGAANFNPDYLGCVYFNRNMVKQYAEEDLYSVVSNGKWTWDKLAELAKAVENVDGIYGHGSPLTAGEYAELAARSQGVTYVKNQDGTVPTVNYLDASVTSNVKDIVSRMYAMIYTDNSYSKLTGTELRELFVSDSLMFMTDTLKAGSEMPGGTQWGILPMPKYDEAQADYISPLSGDAPIFCVIKNTPQYETSGLVLQALNVASHEYVTEAYINKQMDYVLKDNGSINMLELICGTASADFAHLYASGINYLENATYGAVAKAVTTSSSIDSLYRNYKNAANRALASKIKVYN